MPFSVLVSCVTFNTKYCDGMYSLHLSWYSRVEQNLAGNIKIQTLLCHRLPKLIICNSYEF